MISFKYWTCFHHIPAFPCPPSTHCRNPSNISTTLASLALLAALFALDFSSHLSQAQFKTPSQKSKNLLEAVPKGLTPLANTRMLLRELLKCHPCFIERVVGMRRCKAGVKGGSG